MAKMVHRQKSPLFRYTAGFLLRISHILLLKFGPTGKEVDIKDDSLDRWYVAQNKYDPERKEVRHVVLKAFSNQRAQMKFFNQVNDELQTRKKLEEVPAHEFILGGRYEPGYHARVRENRRLNGGVGSNFAPFTPSSGD